MDSTTIPRRDRVSLEPLVTRALCRLQAQGYSKKSLWRYRAVWRQFIRFTREEGSQAVYSQALAERFVQAWSTPRHPPGPAKAGAGMSHSASGPSETSTTTETSSARATACKDSTFRRR